MTIIYAFSYCLATKQKAFLLSLDIPFSEWACDVTQVKKTVGMLNWRNYILGEISLLHYTVLFSMPHPTTFKTHTIVMNQKGRLTYKVYGRIFWFTQLLMLKLNKLNLLSSWKSQRHASTLALYFLIRHVTLGLT